MTLRQIENNPTTWKIVLSISIITYLLTIFGGIGKTDFIFILSGIYLIPLFGLAFEKSIWSKDNWKLLFWLAIIGSVGTVLLLIFAYFNSMFTFSTEQDNQVLDRITGVAMILLLITALRGLYLYANQRDYIWSQK